MNNALATAAQEHFDRAAAEQSLDRVFLELASLTRSVAGSPRLGRALADADFPADAKRALLEDMTKGHYSSITLDLVSYVATEQRVVGKNLAALLTDVTARAAFASAEAANKLDAVEQALYRFADVIRANPDLREALNDPGVPNSAKCALVTDLASAKVDDSVVELLFTLISLDHGRDLDERAEELADESAERRGGVVAVVRTAVELDDDRRKALLASLKATLGKPVAGRFTVDPSIIGSVVVRVGDEVFDGSVVHRIDQARQALVG